MYFLGLLHSWFCEDCSYADSYWRLRAFWAGRDHKTHVPKRCPDLQLWHDMWKLGSRAYVEGLDF